MCFCISGIEILSLGITGELASNEACECCLAVKSSPELGLKHEEKRLVLPEVELPMVPMASVHGPSSVLASLQNEADEYIQ